MRVAAAALLVLLVALPSQGAAPRRAALHLQATAPLAVRGTGFGAGEQVVLNVTGGGTPARAVVRASRSGSFSTTFRSLRLDRCTEFGVRAVGRQGSRALLQVTPACKKDRGPPKRQAPAPDG